MQGFERRNLFGQQPDAARDGPALEVNVRAETADALAAEAQIHGFVALQFLALRGRHQGQQQISRALGGERRTRECESTPPYAQRHGNVGDQQQIGRAEPHGVRQHGIQRGEVLRIVLPGIARAGRGTVQFRDNLRQLILVARQHLKYGPQACGADPPVRTGPPGPARRRPRKADGASAPT